MKTLFRRSAKSRSCRLRSGDWVRSIKVGVNIWWSGRIKKTSWLK